MRNYQFPCLEQSQAFLFDKPVVSNEKAKPGPSGMALRMVVSRRRNWNTKGFKLNPREATLQCFDATCMLKRMKRTGQAKAAIAGLSPVSVKL